MSISGESLAFVIRVINLLRYKRLIRLEAIAQSSIDHRHHADAAAMWLDNVEGYNK